VANQKPAIKRDCVTCGTEFTPRNRNQIYCSEECRPSSRRLYRIPKPKEKPCAYCGRPFTKVHPNDRYCAEHRKGNHPVPSLSKAPVQVEKPCRLCGKTFTTTDNRFEFCSAECNAQASSEQRLKSLLRQRKRWKHPNPVVIKNCPFCGTEFATGNVKKKFCDRACAIAHERLLKKIMRKVPPEMRMLSLKNSNNKA
jgi:predicted nucleic acid-binding Zn ribbon protein